MSLDETRTVSRIGINECHTIITVLVRNDIGVTASLPLRQSLSRHDKNRPTDNLTGLHTAVFQRTVNGNNPRELRFNCAVAADTVLVHCLCATCHPQIEVTKIRVKKHVCYIKIWHLYPSQHR
uniref:Uncharacterized protein n=1 Tax=Myoviridae sp. ctnhb8 TaxID=2825171 RepID=A0A8S5VEC4_9CAUD|nr:MAG TPA: hypothetical protein [Myoviridae sp. ctnhb8]